MHLGDIGYIHVLAWYVYYVLLCGMLYVCYVWYGGMVCFVGSVVCFACVYYVYGLYVPVHEAACVRATV